MATFRIGDVVWVTESSLPIYELAPAGEIRTIQVSQWMVLSLDMISLGLFRYSGGRPDLRVLKRRQVFLTREEAVRAADDVEKFLVEAGEKIVRCADDE